jgi:OOP family OmpA-OmpF porin
MKKIIMTFLLTTLVQSANAKGLYLGYDYLWNSYDSGITNVSSNLDEKDNGYKVFLGTDINENLGLELSYQDFGKASLSGVSGNQFRYGGTLYQFNATASLTSSADSYGIAAKPKIKLAEGFEGYGLLGFHKWDSKFTISSTTATASANDDGTDPFYGLGLSYNTGNLQIRAGYTIYKLDSEEVKSTNLGLAYKF